MTLKVKPQSHLNKLQTRTNRTLYQKDHQKRLLPQWRERPFLAIIDSIYEERVLRDVLWIVGLGNPGKQYQHTRHNVGFMAIDQLAQRWNIDVSRSKGKSLIGEGRVNGKRVFLLKPMTYMNLSGEAVREFMEFYKVSIDSAIVVYDDLDTTVGQIRLRYKGSAGGHNGIKSIIAHAGTQQFNRVRIGVSRPESGRSIVDYVLSPFSKEETALLPNVLDKTCEALEYFLDHPFENVMAKFNGQE